MNQETTVTIGYQEGTAPTVEYGHCNDCGYENTSSSDDCHRCGSLNKIWDECTIEEWYDEH